MKLYRPIFGAALGGAGIAMVSIAALFAAGATSSVALKVLAGIELAYFGILVLATAAIICFNND